MMIEAATSTTCKTPAPALPVGAWDCHAHVYGPFDRYPLAADAAYQPTEATFSSLRALHAKLGIERGVLVQAVPYGRDHSVILDAIAASEGHYCGVALIDDEISEDELLALHAGGIRGVRFNLMSHLRAPSDPVRYVDLASRVAPLGWHVLVHGQGTQALSLVDNLAKIDVAVVIDHMARPDLTEAIGDASDAALLAALASSNVWIKLSGVDRAMGGKAGPWDRAVEYTLRLLEAAPDRAIWGSDWPHPNVSGPVPDDAQLLAFALAVCNSTETAQALFVDNPARLYA